MYETFLYVQYDVYSECSCLCRIINCEKMLKLYSFILQKNIIDYLEHNIFISLLFKDFKQETYA